MTAALRRKLVARLPEPVLRRLLRVRHGRSAKQRRAPAGRVRPGVVPAVVDRFDAHAVRAESVAGVSRALQGAGVAYVLIPGPHGTVGQIAVSARDRRATVRALESGLGGPGWRIDPRRAAARRATPTIRVQRVLATAGGQVLSEPETGCEIAFWTRVDRDDLPRTDGGIHERGTYLAPTANGVVRYLSEPMWRQSAASFAHWSVTEPKPDMFEVGGAIDVVYTWVDGSDPDWRARKAAHAPGRDAAVLLSASATSLARFLSRDELRYSMRSVAMYASWVRTIYLVTDGQVPTWLDTSHPKVVLVDHRDIFADPSALPVFNSHAIESQLHHIDGLAERYLYLNDDVFFGRMVFPELFFHGNGIAKFLLAPDTTIDLGSPSVRDLPAIAAAKNQRDFLEAEFGVTVRRKVQHGPHPQVRSVVEEMERRYPTLFDSVSGSRFRHPDDVSIPSSLQHFYGYVRGRAVPGEWTYQYQDIGRESTRRRLDQIMRERPQTFCLNDLDSAADQLPEQQVVLDEFFGRYFPVPAPWER